MRPVDEREIRSLMRAAAESPRLRTILRLHEHEEPVQRMINALMPGSYITPHKHENPDKVELFSILFGRAACIQFDEHGLITEVHVLNDSGPIRVVEIAPRTYHTLLALQPSALLEIIQGPYEASTHKQFAPWAPLEDDVDAMHYYARMQSMVSEWLIE